MMDLLSKLQREEEGQTMAEYAVVLAVITLLVVVALDVAVRRHRRRARPGYGHHRLGLTLGWGGAPAPPQHPHRSRDSGQSIVEFTLVLLPLLLILFGIIELGVVMFDKVTVVHDAREAARLAAVNDPSGKTLMADAPAGSSVTFTCATDPNSGNPAGQYNVGDTITAHVTYSHAFVFPLISSILGNTIDLSSNATFRLEGQPTAYC